MLLFLHYIQLYTFVFLIIYRLKHDFFLFSNFEDGYNEQIYWLIMVADNKKVHTGKLPIYNIQYKLLVNEKNEICFDLISINNHFYFQQCFSIFVITKERILI